MKEKRYVFISLPFKNRKVEDILLSIKKMEMASKEYFDKDDNYELVYINNYYSDIINKIYDEISNDVVNKKMTLMWQAIRKMCICNYFIGFENTGKYTGCEIENLIAKKYMDKDNIYLLKDWDMIPDCISR